MTTTATETADARTVQYGALCTPEQIRAALTGTERGIARALAGSIEEDAARADALARALQAMANGLETGHAIASACKMAVRDAVERAANLSLISLDATTGDGTTTLADMLDSDHVGTARLAMYDEASGIYRGVSRVPHPEDIIRPLEMPAPEQLADAARASLTPEATRVLEITLAVNVALAEQRRQAVEQIKADVARLDKDISRQAYAKQARAALTVARRDERSDRSPWQKRTSTVAQEITGRDTGRTRAAVSAAQDDAAAAYWTHRDALTAAALEAWTARLDDAAETQRARLDNARAIASTPQRLERLTTYQAIHSARQGRRARALEAIAAATTVATPQPAAAPATGATLADAYDREPGQATRPRRALAEWDRALTGMKRSRTAAQRPDGSDQPATADKGQQTPQQSRTHADTERTARRTHTGQHAPQATAQALPRTTAPGVATTAPSQHVEAYACTARDQAAAATRRDQAARLTAYTATLGTLPDVAARLAADALRAVYVLADAPARLATRSA